MQSIPMPQRTVRASMILEKIRAYRGTSHATIVACTPDGERTDVDVSVHERVSFRALSVRRTLGMWRSAGLPPRPGAPFGGRPSLAYPARRCRWCHRDRDGRCPWGG